MVTLDPLLYPEGQGDGGYVAFLGRFAPEKAPHLAVDAAQLANVPLHIGGTYHEVAHDYYTRELAQRLAVAEQVLCCGELGHAAKVELLRGASALLFPIQWEEPFGLVMIESMLVGTPVIAFQGLRIGESRVNMRLRRVEKRVHIDQFDTSGAPLRVDIELD